MDICEDYLDVSIFGDIADYTVKAVDATAYAAKYALGTEVVSQLFLEFSSEVLEG